MAGMTRARGSTRRDGWNAVKRKRFLEVYEDTGVVRVACRAAGMTPQGAYQLKARDPDFSDAWDAALDASVDDLLGAVVARSTNGVEREYYYHGKLMKKMRDYPDRLAMFVLGRYRPTLHQRRTTAAVATEAGATTQAPEPKLQTRLAITTAIDSVLAAAARLPDG